MAVMEILQVLWGYACSPHYSLPKKVLQSGKA